MLDTVAFLPTEGRVVVEGDVLEVERRLREGDDLIGWEGDENMRLMVDLETGLYDVWTLGPDRTPVLAVAERPYCDQRLIEDVIRADTRRFDVAARVIKRNEEVAAGDRAARAEQNAELADKLQSALMKDLGHHYGGLTRRVH